MTRDTCFPGGGTHITRDTCFPGGGTHITRDTCFPGGGTYISRGICISQVSWIIAMLLIKILIIFFFRPLSTVHLLQSNQRFQGIEFVDRHVLEKHSI